MPGPGKPFQKGQSGNPGGRKGFARVTRLARIALRDTRPGKSGDLAFNRLSEILATSDDNMEAIAAAKALMPYAHGQPKQSIDVLVQDDNRPVTQLTRAELEVIARGGQKEAN